MKRKTKKVFKCSDGPYEGQQIELDVSNMACFGTLVFGISSFEDGQKGRYVRDSEHSGNVKWERQNENLV